MVETRPPPPDSSEGWLGVGALAGVVLQLQSAALLRLIAGAEPLDLLRRHPEGRVGHAQRLEQPRAQELAEAHPRQLLDQVTHHVDRHRIVPGRARRELQRQGRQLADERRQAARRLEVVDLQLAVGRVDAGAHHEAVGQARRMGDQVHHLHRPLRRRGDEAGRRVGQQSRHAAGIDAEVLPFGDVRRHRVIETQRAFLDQHHQRDRGDRLGHGIDAEDRVFLHRLGPFQVHVAGEAGVHELALAIDLGEDAGQVAAVDVAALHHLIQPGQSRTRHSDGFRRGHLRAPPIFSQH